MASEAYYSSHQSTLTALARLVEIRNVLEFGSGPSSTANFLNRDLFPDLKCLLSVENNWGWYIKMRDLLSSDARLGLVFYGGKLSGYVPEAMSKGFFDLIFIDDADNPVDRAATIQAVVRNRKSWASIIVIHDFETPEYVAAARDMPHVYVAENPPLPSTGVLWRDAPLKEADLL